MTITRSRRDIAFEAPGIAELLIEEARRKGRRRRLAGGGFIVAVVLMFAAIAFAVLRGPTEPNTGRPTSPAVTTAATARTLCHNILGGRALNSKPEQLSTVRQFTYGPGVRPVPDAFPGLGKDQTVGVCWTGRPSTGYELYAVAFDYTPVRIEAVRGVGFTSTPQPGFVDIP
jgi:hypothetical protein